MRRSTYSLFILLLCMVMLAPVAAQPPAPTPSAQDAETLKQAAQVASDALDRGNHHGALQLYEQAHQLDPNNQATSYFLGELYVEENQIEKGVQFLEQALTSAYAPAEAAIGRALVMKAAQTKDIDEQDILYA